MREETAKNAIIWIKDPIATLTGPGSQRVCIVKCKCHSDFECGTYQPQKS